MEGGAGRRVEPAGDGCQPTVGAARGADGRGTEAVAGRRSAMSRNTRKPIPVSSRATPMTIANRAVLSAKYAVFRAVVSAVSVTQIWRAGLLTGFSVLGSMAASFSSLVGLPALSRNWPIWA